VHHDPDAARLRPIYVELPGAKQRDVPEPRSASGGCGEHRMDVVGGREQHRDNVRMVYPVARDIAASNAWVRWVTCSIVSSSTVVAPRRARTRSLGPGTPTLSASGPGEELEGIVR
jgi:hypothetical protein